MAVSENDANGVKQVPWFSLAEWHDVYKQIYSNDIVEQTKAYEMLLAWKARMPKLPVGVDNTLSILQVCLRDREWMSKIDSGELPMYYEKDLSLMYSTTIMRFLNHISAIGQTKQTSLFQIAKQLKIPEWIVALRHNAAHGHELAPLEVLRMAINILLEWLHEEYWAAEARMMEEHYMKEADRLEEEEESEETQVLTDLVELWTSVSLYIHAGHRLVLDIPDSQLRKTLKDLRTYALSQQNRKNLDIDEYGQDNISSKEYNLTAAQALLLTEISMHLTKSESILKKDIAICDVLCKNEAFLLNSDIVQIFMLKGEDRGSSKKNVLPSNMLRFWKDIIVLLHKKKMLGTLIFKLLSVVNEERESEKKRSLAASWINSIIYSFVQLDIAQSVCRTIKCKSKRDTELSTKDLSQQIKGHVHFNHPHLKNVLWLDISSIIPHFLLDVNFLSKFLLQVNEFSAELIQPILELIASRIDVQTRKHLRNLLKIYTFQEHNNDNDDDDSETVNEKIFTIEDLYANSTEHETRIHKKRRTKTDIHSLADQAIRNLQWKPAVDTFQWTGCPIGVLPWQNSLKSLEPLEFNLSKRIAPTLDSQIIPGIVNSKNLKMKSRINWDNVLQGKRKAKRKYNEDVAVVIMNRALEIAKKRK